jgi:hypothetical protein
VAVSDAAPLKPHEALSAMPLPAVPRGSTQGTVLDMVTELAAFLQSSFPEIGQLPQSLLNRTATLAVAHVSSVTVEEKSWNVEQCEGVPE